MKATFILPLLAASAYAQRGPTGLTTDLCNATPSIITNFTYFGNQTNFATTITAPATYAPGSTRAVNITISGPQGAGVRGFLLYAAESADSQVHLGKFVNLNATQWTTLDGQVPTTYAPNCTTFGVNGTVAHVQIRDTKTFPITIQWIPPTTLIQTFKFFAVANQRWANNTNGYQILESAPVNVVPAYAELCRANPNTIAATGNFGVQTEFWTKVTLSKKNYGPAQKPVNVTIDGPGAGINGLLLYAAIARGNPQHLGSWILPSNRYQTLDNRSASFPDCSSYGKGTTVAHTGIQRTIPFPVTFQWIPPTQNVGQVKFWVVAVQNNNSTGTPVQGFQVIESAAIKYNANQ
ncbi:hypothetical protein HK097_007916 [Rhizophlyctis rosea]|uniref:Reelin domain-containing protein n=1 Tax=Rhizophlyctis rosea TaxID=64517 RepID=A0AAD5SD82_9FUNG|nr:hypothetical protein HK097_007916 [Rhizophlyctis rosea]